MIRFLAVIMLFSLTIFAEQTVTIQPGGHVILEAVSESIKVVCEATVEASKCICEYDARYYTPMLLFKSHKVKLASTDVRDKCFAEIATNPSCK